MSMDGRYPKNAGAIFRVCGMVAGFCSCKTCISAFPGGRILKMQEQFSVYVGWRRFFSRKTSICSVLGGRI